MRILANGCVKASPGKRVRPTKVCPDYGVLSGMFDCLVSK